MADDTLDQRLAYIEAALPTLATKADIAELRGKMATKTDIAGVATNASFRLLGEQSNRRPPRPGHYAPICAC